MNFSIAVSTVPLHGACWHVQRLMPVTAQDSDLFFVAGGDSRIPSSYAGYALGRQLSDFLSNRVPVPSS